MQNPIAATMVLSGGLLYVFSVLALVCTGIYYHLTTIKDEPVSKRVRTTQSVRSVHSSPVFSMGSILKQAYWNWEKKGRPMRIVTVLSQFITWLKEKHEPKQYQQ